MKMKSKNLKQNYNSELKVSPALNFKFWLHVLRFSFLAFCLSASGAVAETPSKQLDPTNLLMAYLAKLSQNMSSPSVPGAPGTLSRVWEPPAQLTEPPSTGQGQSQTGPVPIRREPRSIARGSFMLRGEPELNKCGVAPVNLAAGVDKKSPQGSSISAGSSNSQVARQLQRVRITAPKNERDKENKNELQQIIEQIHSVEFKPQKDVSGPIITIGPVTTTEPLSCPDSAGSSAVSRVPTSQVHKRDKVRLGSPQEVAKLGPRKMAATSDTEAPKEVKGKESESKSAAHLPYESVTDQTLQMLKNLSQHPKQLDNPFELGEVLFLSGHLKEARLFYQEALNRRDANDIASAQDKAWILFQIGNCLRDGDPPMAIETYRQLIMEYPDSLWADLAKARDRLINWHQKDKPWTLIGENQIKVEHSRIE